ncbi:PAS domain-containing protein [Oceanospirillum maris]|uniref:PAS domain-containing protein n=1 Tax=Oceanospirillum maris TaxID=64977 RepID=UPI00041A957F|nr:PAS domain-containing protein [Oceanospirillum maris]
MLASKILHDDEVFLGSDELIISKTDLQGRITYANRTFIRLAGYDEEALLDKPHNMIRHPDMPKGVFKFLWQELQQGHEFFGFIKNATIGQGFYWVFANITPDFDSKGRVQGYFSVRRSPSAEAIKVIEPIYKNMIEIERRHSKPDAPHHSFSYLNQVLDSKRVSYERFVMQLQAL